MQAKHRFKVGDRVVRVSTGVIYPILRIEYCDYIIRLPSGQEHLIEIKQVDKDCRPLTKLEKALK